MPRKPGAIKLKSFTVKVENPNQPSSNTPGAEANHIDEHNEPINHQQHHDHSESQACVNNIHLKD